MAGRSRLPRPEIPLYHHLSNLSIGNLAKNPTNYFPEFGHFANRQECNNLLYYDYRKGKGNTNPVETISAEDLSYLQLVIADELEHRRLCAKETAWNEVVEAIKNYCSAFGSIEYNTYEEEYYINDDNNFSTVGKILF